MRSLNLSIVIDTFFGSCYILSIITSILFWKWYREDKKLSVLLIEKNMVSMPEIKAMTSHGKKYQTLIKKQQSAQEVLQYKLNENIQDMQDYYAMWAHQIKVPLSVLDLMNQTGTVDKYETGNQLLVINQYLDMMLQFIRLKNFNQDLTYQKISIQATLRSVIKDYKYWFIHKNLSICLNENDFIVVSDPKWLHFVFEQIIFNAIKYTPNGKINIICEENGRVIIQDTGIGIASSDLPLIFNQGYTGFNGRINSNSSGLGLYMVKTILNSLGHDIQISSQINVGTKVIIDFEQTEIK
ncbi:histidine kinase [Leuconostoc litchii]|nr:histidine kinase [Leuconostoc litchii]